MSIKKGNVLTKCFKCKKWMRVPVTFLSFNEPFTPTIHTCEFCKHKNFVHDPHKYNEDGTIENN